MANIIGLVGFAGSGKDTVASYLIDNFGYSKLSFAKPLKDAVSAIFGWDRHLLEGTTPESRAWRELPDTWWEDHLDWTRHPLRALSERFTPRAALQLIGTNILRAEFCDSIWLLRVKKELDDALLVDPSAKYVITDCRFHNEFKLITRAKGRIVRVKRGDDPYWVNTAIDAMDHDSDTRLDSLKFMKLIGIHESEWNWLSESVNNVIDNNSTLEALHNQINHIVST